MKKQTSLCMGCMAEMKDSAENTENCPVCGYAKSSVFLSSYLAPETVLAERYIIGRLISYNGEGALYIAYDEQSGAKIAVREYMPDTLCGRKKEEEAVEVNPQYVALYKTYLSEFLELNKALMNTDASMRLQRVTDVFTENNTAYAVYEYIAGISLKTYLSNLGGVLPWEQVRELFTPLFTTLSLLHAEGIIHRGISPSTIYMNDKSELVLVNFGITAVRTYGSEINYDVFAGYAAPEQYNVMEKHGSHTDVYGVAAVLYKVLTGQMPINASERKENDTLTAPMLINRNIPASVSAVIMKGLELNVEERTRTIGGFIDGLFEAGSVNVPDSTNEILIKKPARKTENEVITGSAGKTSRNQPRQSRKSSKKSGSYAGIIIGFVILGLAVLASVLAIIFSEEIQERLDARRNNGEDETEASSGVPIPDITTTTPPRTTPNGGDDTPPPSGPMIILSDFTTRRFESIQNNTAFEFLNFNPIYEFNDEHLEGIIFAQDIEPGTPVESGKEITVWVSKGPEKAPLPNYVLSGGARASRDDYTALLFSMGIKYEVEEEFHEEIEAGLVTRCSIAAGTIINFAAEEVTTVTVYVSKGPDPSLATSSDDDDDGDGDTDNDGDGE